jgi:hypothetical protein
MKFTVLGAGCSGPCAPEGEAARPETAFRPYVRVLRLPAGNRWLWRPSLAADQAVELYILAECRACIAAPRGWSLRSWDAA